jgi:hypothetical protein
MKQANIKRIRSRFSSIRFEANKFFQRVRRTLRTAVSRDVIASTEQPETTVGTVHLGQETDDMTARTGQQGQDS